MTNPFEERYEGNFLDALDLPEGELVPVVVESIVEPFAEKDSAGKPIKSAIMAFAGKRKRLIVNVTNWKNMKAQFDKEPKDWIGKTIHIQRRYLDAARGFGINNTLCIRIVPPIGTPILKSAANFMGSPTPYGVTSKSASKKQTPPPAPIPPAAEKPQYTNLGKWGGNVTPEKRGAASLAAADKLLAAGNLDGLEAMLAKVKAMETDFLPLDFKSLVGMIDGFIAGLKLQQAGAGDAAGEPHGPDGGNQ